MSPTESTLSSRPSSPGSQGNGWEKAWKRLGSVIFILLCVEIGAFLVLLPWSAIWDRSLLLRHYPVLRPLFDSSYLRGAISGLGLVNLGVGVSQAWHFRRPAPTVPAGD
jgi:hypothetical protein